MQTSKFYIKRGDEVMPLLYQRLMRDEFKLDHIDGLGGPIDAPDLLWMGCSKRFFGTYCDIEISETVRPGAL